MYKILFKKNPDDTSRHDEYYQWLIDTSEKLQNSFKKIIN
jgi:hypothetical protein